jgi:peroxiredoxin
MTAPMFTLTDQSGRPFSLADHLDAAVVLFFLRGDW